MLPECLRLRLNNISFTYLSVSAFLTDPPIKKGGEVPEEALGEDCWQANSSLKAFKLLSLVPYLDIWVIKVRVRFRDLRMKIPSVTW